MAYQWHIIAAPGHPFLAASIEQVLYNVENHNAFKFGHGGIGVLNVSGSSAYTLAIYPLVKKYSHRKVISWVEGIFYTMLEGDDSHRELDSNHYARSVIAPVTSRSLTGWSWLVCWLAELAIRPLSRVCTLNY